MDAFRHKASLAVEVLIAYGRVQWYLRRYDFQTTVAKLRRDGGPSPRRREPCGEARLARAVTRVLRPLPFGTRCLTRSLVLLRLLAKRGVPGSLVIAVEAEPDGQLGAHAWVEVDGRPLLGSAPGYGRLLTL